MRKKSVLYSPRIREIKKKKNRVLRRKILIYLILLIAILTLIGFSLRWQKINIQKIAISGNKVIDTELIKNIVAENLVGNYLYILPKTNFIFYPKDKIKLELSSKYKRLKDITLNVDNLERLNIQVNERTAHYTWCGAIPEDLTINTEEKCYFIDDDGYIFDEAPYFSGEVYFKFYGTNDINTSDPMGSYYAKDIFNKLITLNTTLKTMGLKTSALSIKGNGEIKVFLSGINKSATRPEIILNTKSDFNKIAENLQAALTTAPLQSDFEKKYASLLYIDLRFGNKVYYKFKQ